MVRLELDRRIIVLQRAVGIALGLVSDGAVVESRSVVRIERQSSIKILNRPVQVLLPEIAHGSAEVRPREVLPAIRAGFDQRGAASNLLVRGGSALTLAPGKILVDLARFRRGDKN